MAEFPVEPMMSKMLIASEKYVKESTFDKFPHFFSFPELFNKEYIKHTSRKRIEKQRIKNSIYVLIYLFFTKLLSARLEVRSAGDKIFALKPRVSRDKFQTFLRLMSCAFSSNAKICLFRSVRQTLRSGSVGITLRSRAC